MRISLAKKISRNEIFEFFLFTMLTICICPIPANSAKLQGHAKPCSFYKYVMLLEIRTFCQKHTSKKSSIFTVPKYSFKPIFQYCLISAPLNPSVILAYATVEVQSTPTSFCPSVTDAPATCCDPWPCGCCEKHDGRIEVNNHHLVMESNRPSNISLSNSLVVRSCIQFRKKSMSLHRKRCKHVTTEEEGRGPDVTVPTFVFLD